MQMLGLATQKMRSTKHQTLSLVHHGMLEDCVKRLMRTQYSSITPIATTLTVCAKNKGMYYRKAKEEDLRKSLK